MKTSSAATVSLRASSPGGLYRRRREGERDQGSRRRFGFGGLIIGFGCGESGGACVVKRRSSPSGAGPGVGGARLGSGRARPFEPSLTMSRFVIGLSHAGRGRTPPQAREFRNA